MNELGSRRDATGGEMKRGRGRDSTVFAVFRTTGTPYYPLFLFGGLLPSHSYTVTQSLLFVPLKCYFLIIALT